MNKTTSITLVGVTVNIFLGFIKIIVGIIASSQALVADGIHSFSDLVSDAAVIIGAKFWSLPADDSHPYGHGRIETLVNIFIGVLILTVGIGIGWNSLKAVSLDKNLHPPGWSALFVALLSVFVKEILYRWNARWGTKLRSRALIANGWHHRSDALSSLPVAVAVVAGHLFPGLVYLDQIAAMIVAIMIIHASWGIMSPSFKELLESRESEKLEKEIISIGESYSDIREIHKVRSRRIGGAVLVDFHLLVHPEMSVEKAHDIAEDLKDKIKEEKDEIIDIIVHVEPHKSETCLK
ncbi:MAG: cation diffusion facilitator family transporter [Myxococcota bacterium]